MTSKMYFRRHQAIPVADPFQHQGQLGTSGALCSLRQISLATLASLARWHCYVR